jgi:dienelactone hydrolase
MMHWPLLAVLGATLIACAGAQSARFDPVSRDQVVGIPLTDATGQTVSIQARLCRPATDTPARLVVINHGSPPNAADRPGMQPAQCTSEPARWFLDRGYVVMFPLRRGYGATGGPWAEANGRCAEVDYVHAGLETARDIAATVDYGTALPFVRRNGAVVVGQSAGGWGTIAYDSLPHANVSAFVAMAGGRGGHQDNVPNRNCAPDKLAEAARQFGTTASTPMLWVYTANDSYFAPPIARALHAAFIAGGGKATLIQPGPFDGDGHRLFFGAGGSEIWGSLVETYLASQPGPTP